MIPPLGFDGLNRVFGKFKYTELSKGAVDIDDTWERDNLVTVGNFGLKWPDGKPMRITLHRLLMPIFEESLKAAMNAAPQYPIRMWGGFCPRHMSHDPKKPLSVHTWGAAFDINWDKNPMSKKLITDIPTAFVLEFTKRGWDWGGNWKSSKDAMHFQFAKGV